MSLFARRPSPAMVVAVVALSFALAGSAVAGTGAVTFKLDGKEKKQVKKIAKKQGKKQANKQITKRAPELSVASATNAQQLGGVDAGEYQQRLFAVVDEDATLVRGAGAVGAEIAATAHYDVEFDRDVTQCAYVAQLGAVDASLPPDGFAVVAHANEPDQVRVRIHATNGATMPASFHLQVAC